jgi:hypothetical protein
VPTTTTTTPQCRDDGDHHSSEGHHGDDEGDHHSDGRDGADCDHGRRGCEHGKGHDEHHGGSRADEHRHDHCDTPGSMHTRIHAELISTTHHEPRTAAGWLVGSLGIAGVLYVVNRKIVASRRL